MRRGLWGTVLAGLLAATMGVLGTACGGGSAGTAASGGTPAATQRPEDRVVSAAEVSAGLAKLVDLADQTAAATGTDQAKAKQLNGEIEPVWKTIEGTIKKNSQDSYLAFEDAFGLLSRAVDGGNAADARSAAGQVRTAADDYQKRYGG